MKLNYDYFKDMMEVLKKGSIEFFNDIFFNKKYIKNIPNLLTLARLIICIITCFFISKGINHFTLLIYGIGALTDTLDGMIARKLNATSEFGKYFDAIVDKIFVIAPTIVLGFNNHYLSLLIANEFIIGSINTIALLNNKMPSSNIIGRVKTWFLFATVLLSIGLNSQFVLNYIPNIDNLFKYAFTLSFDFQMISTIKYIVDYSKKEKDFSIIEVINTYNNEEFKIEPSNDEIKKQILELEKVRSYMEFHPEENCIKIKKRNKL